MPTPENTDPQAHDPIDGSQGEDQAEDAATEAAASAAAGASNGLDAQVIATFESELAEAHRQADEHHDRYLRAEADLQNVRRRSDQRREEALRLQKRTLLTRFLDVRDNLERALQHTDDADDSPMLEGLRATLRVIDHLLEREGAAPIVAEDAAFDPELHEAVAVVPVPNVKHETVISVERSGYTIDGELLRPARVVVGRPADG